MWKTAAVLALVIPVVGLGTTATRAEEEAPPKPPAAGTMRFSTSATAFPANVKAEYRPQDAIYALVGFGKPFRELLKQADKSTNVVVKLFEGDRQLASHLFFPQVESFEGATWVLEIVPDPASTTQFNHKVARALAGLPVGKHALKVVLWSFKALKNDLAVGTFTFHATEEGKADLVARADRIQEAKKRSKSDEPKKASAPKIQVRHDGADFLQIEGDRIRKDGSFVGSFDGDTVRRDGSIVGEIKGTVFRHEGADAWSLDKGNLYAGTEIRFDGSVIGAIESSGRITWEGSEWGTVKPYGGTPQETMRIFAALYYFSDYFRKR